MILWNNKCKTKTLIQHIPKTSIKGIFNNNLKDLIKIINYSQSPLKHKINFNIANKTIISLVNNSTVINTNNNKVKITHKVNKNLFRQWKILELVEEDKVYLD